MNRLAGIITAVVGIVFVLSSVLKILPGFTGTGVALLLLGGLMIGLSFVPKPEVIETARMTTADTLTKIFYAPAAVFQNLRRHPRWLAALVIMTALSAVYNTAFTARLTPEVVVGYTIDKTKEMSMLNDEARKNIEAGRADAVAEAKNPVNQIGQTINGFVGLVFWTAFLAAVFLLVTMIMGGKINYWQAFSVAAYSMFPALVLNQILSLLLLFLKDPTEIHPILGRSSLVQDNLNFLANPAQSPVLYSLLGMFGLFTFYQIWLRVVGLKNAGETISSSVALTVALAFWIIGIVLSVAMAFLFPSFLS